jgi:hypothetical protein
MAAAETAQHFAEVVEVFAHPPVHQRAKPEESGKSEFTAQLRETGGALVSNFGRGAGDH